MNYTLSKSKVTLVPTASIVPAANKLLEELRPFCKKIDITGDLRRDATLSDRIEFLFVPNTYEHSKNFFETQTIWVLGLFEVLNKYGITGAFSTAQFEIKHPLTSSGLLPVIMHATTPCQYGALLAITTGGDVTRKELLRALTRRALCLTPQSTIRDIKQSKDVPFYYEREFFSTLGVTYRHPANRY